MRKPVFDDKASPLSPSEPADKARIGARSRDHVENPMLYRPLPPLAYLPLLVIYFAFAPIAMAARSGSRSATAEQVNATYSLGGSFAMVMRFVVLPAALPEILTGLRIAIGFDGPRSSRPRWQRQRRDSGRWC
jgi:hypothetical protein